MQHSRRVYVVQVWLEGQQLVLRLREQHQPEAKFFRSWAELLLHLHTDLMQQRFEASLKSSTEPNL